MARYWVGGAAAWNGTAGSKWATTSGGAGGAAVPTAADDVFLDAASGAVQVDLSATSVCRSVDCTGFTGTLNFAAASVLAVGDASGGAVKFVAGMTVALNGGTLSLVSTSNNGGTGWGVTTGGKVLPSPNFNGVGGKWVLQDAFSCGTSTLFVANGGFFGNGQTITCGSFDSSASTARTVDLTNCTVTVSSNWTFTTTTNLTFVSTGSTINIVANLAMANLSYATVVANGAGTQSISGAPTFVNFTRTGTAVKTSGLGGTSTTFTVTGTLTLGGNTTQGVNRLLVASSAVGTTRTIVCTGAAVVISGDVDFKDITISGSPSWTNAGSAYVGDCGGNNSYLTDPTRKTASATQTATGTASFSWSTHGWTTRVPLPQDDVSVPNAFIAGRTVTVDMPRLGKDITFTCTGSPTLTNSTTNESYGSLTLTTGVAPSGTNVWTLAGRGTHTLTSAAATFTQGLTFSGPSGTYTLQDALATNGTLSLFDGTFTANNQNVTATAVLANSGRTTVVNMGTGTWTLMSTATTTIWSANAGTTTLNSSTSTIVVGSTSANTRTFSGGGKTYGTFTYTIAGSTGQLTHTGGTGTTFATINFSDVTNARTIAFPTATTTTVGTFNVNGTAGKLMSVTGDLFSANQQSCDYLSISSSDATGGPWYASHSTDGGSNTGWNIEADAFVFATFSAPLGGLTASVTATVEHPATFSAPLGELAATAAATPDHPAVLSAQLGELAATLTATVEHPATFTAPLGELSASASAGVEHPATFDAPLGALAATAQFVISKQAVLDAQLGGLTAAMSATVTSPAVVPAVFSAALGALVATMAATVPDRNGASVATVAALRSSRISVTKDSSTVLVSAGRSSTATVSDG